MRESFRREWWDPMVREFLGRYPPGHPHHQESALLRFYPLAMTLLVLGVVAWIVAGVW